MKKRIAIIGGGISGLSCARVLCSDPRLFQVDLFEKFHEVGGRMRSLKVENFVFDHGAQYFTARSEPFNKFIQESSQYIKEWKAGEEGIQSLEFDEENKKYVIKPLSSTTKRYTGDQNIGLVCKNMMKNLGDDIFKSYVDIEITKIEFVNNQWKLYSPKTEIENVFDMLLVSGTPNEIFDIIGSSSSKKPSWFDQIKNIKMKPVGALMLTFSQKQHKIPFDAAFVNHSEKSTWICRENTKPGKQSEEEEDNWLIHFSPQFSDECWGLKSENNETEISDQELFEIVQKEILGPFGVQFDRDQVSMMKSYVWKESDCKQSLDIGFLYDEEINCGLIVDFINNDRVEGGFLSGYLMGRHLIDSL